MYNNFIQKSYSLIRNNAAEASTNDTINKRDFLLRVSGRLISTEVRRSNMFETPSINNIRTFIIRLTLLMVECVKVTKDFRSFVVICRTNTTTS